MIAPPLVLLARVWPPMLATLANFASVGADYDIVETKYDGFRALGSIARGQVALQSRNGLDLSARFVGVRKALQLLGPREAVLDGELVARTGRDFHSLQTARAKVEYVIFDILWLDGRDLRHEPLSARRSFAETLITQKGALRLSERLPGPLPSVLQRARAENLEGVLCKRGDSHYHAGRSRDWLKVKIVKTDEFYIVGYVPHSAAANQVGSLALASKSRTPRFVGKVGTGFSSELSAALYQRLAQLRTNAKVEGAPADRDICWCRPRLIAEVAFSEFTPLGRLRHPSFKRLREDKERYARN